MKDISRLIQKFDASRMTGCSKGSGRPQSARTVRNICLGSKLMSIQEDQLKTQKAPKR